VPSPDVDLLDSASVRTLVRQFILPVISERARP
jgi:hypothetical protein